MDVKWTAWILGALLINTIGTIVDCWQFADLMKRKYRAWRLRERRKLRNEVVAEMVEEFIREKADAQKKEANAEAKSRPVLT